MLSESTRKTADSSQNLSEGNLSRISDRISKWSEDHRGLIFLLILSLLIKTAIASFTEVINVDGSLYLSAAQKFAAGNFRDGLALFSMPAYSLLIASVHLLIPHWTAAARLISVACSVLVLIPLYFITRDLFSRRAAFWACAAWVLSPRPNEWAVEMIRDVPFLLFFAWSVVFALRAIRSKKTTDFILAALFNCIAVLFRIEVLAFIPFFSMFLAVLALRNPDERISWIRGILIWLGIPLMSLLAASLMLGMSWDSLNRMDQVIQYVREFLQFGFLDTYRLIDEQLRAFQKTLPYPDGGQNLIEVVRHYMPFIYFMGLLEAFIKFLFPPFVLSLVLGFRRSSERNRVFVLLLDLLFILLVYYRIITMNSIDERYLLTASFLLYPWIGRGTEPFLAFLERSSLRRTVTVVFIVLFLIAPLYGSFKPLRYQDDVVRRAGEWLAELPRFETATLMTNDGRIPFYAGRGRDYIEYGESSASVAEQLALSEHVDLIIVKISLKKKEPPTFEHYKEVKEFKGKKDKVILYGRF